jgi:hypothetical protein
MAYLPSDANYEFYAANYEPWYGVMYERYPGHPAPSRRTSR